MKVAFNKEKALVGAFSVIVKLRVSSSSAGGHDVMRLMLSAPRPSISWKDNTLVTLRECGMSSQGQDEQRHLQLVDTHLLPNNICRYHGNILSPVLSVSAWVHDI